MRKLAVILLLPLSLVAQEYMGEFSLDTNVYDQAFAAYGIRGPGQESFALNNLDLVCTDYLMMYRKNGGDRYDIFSHKGIIGSVVLPSSNMPHDTLIRQVQFSQTFVDADTNFECIVIYYSESYQIFFKLLDEGGNQILSDTGIAAWIRWA